MMGPYDEYDWRSYDLSEMTEEQQENFKRLLAYRKESANRPPEQRLTDANLPSNRRFLPIFNTFIRSAFPATLDPGEFASLDQLEAAAATLFNPDANSAQILRKGFESLRSLAVDDEQMHTLQYAISCLLMVAMSSETDRVSAAADRERDQLKGITARNQAISLTTERARAIAADLWEQDDEQLIRIGDMAQRVWSVMIDEGLSEHMPEQADRLKVWIKPVAPAYATKGGRAKKPPRT
ncbi:hypothetical protein [Pseudomonas oryzihabitans]|uniref:hypothetical protein n=1 Tax=Pseudomonas oryzihabitans TaxID=47885 RepID=UPI002B1D7428|nr:hypothetical protein [Pseudomonas oryzihabitans]